MRREGGVPPIVTVLVAVAAIAASSIVAWFLWSATRSATQQPVLEVTNAYASCTGTTCAVSFTVRNVGAVQLSSVSITELICETASGLQSPASSSCVMASGQQVTACRATFNSAINDGASCIARLSVNLQIGSSSTVAVGFKVIRP